MSQHIVTGYRPYDFVNADGEKVQGVKVFYLDEGTDDSEHGLFPLNISISYDQLTNLTQVPGVYDLDFKQRRDQKGKPVLVLKSVSLIEPLNVPLFN